MSPKRRGTRLCASWVSVVLFVGLLVAVPFDMGPIGSQRAVADASGYDEAVMDSGPWGYWRLGEATGTSGADRSGNGHGLSYTSVGLGKAGAVVGDADTAIQLTATTDGRASTSASGFTPATVSAEAWMRDTAPRAGGAP